MLPESTNAKPSFGKIVKLLCDNRNQGHLCYKLVSSVYCNDSDLYLVKEYEQYAIIPIIQLADYHTIEVIE